MVLLGIEIALLVIGISAIAKREASLGKGRKITGARAQLWGATMVMPMPIAMTGGFLLGVLSVTQQNEALLNFAPLCDVIAIFACCIAATAIAGRGEQEGDVSVVSGMPTE